MSELFVTTIDIYNNIFLICLMLLGVYAFVGVGTQIILYIRRRRADKYASEFVEKLREKRVYF